MKIIGVIYFVFLTLAITGYVKNIIKLTECDFKVISKCEIVHGIGVIPPVGIITGYLNVQE